MRVREGGLKIVSLTCFKTQMISHHKFDIRNIKAPVRIGAGEKILSFSSMFSEGTLLFSEGIPQFSAGTPLFSLRNLFFKKEPFLILREISF